MSVFSNYSLLMTAPETCHSKASRVLLTGYIARIQIVGCCGLATETTLTSSSVLGALSCAESAPKCSGTTLCSSENDAVSESARCMQAHLVAHGQSIRSQVRRSPPCSTAGGYRLPCVRRRGLTAPGPRLMRALQGKESVPGSHVVTSSLALNQDLRWSLTRSDPVSLIAYGLWDGS